MAGETKTKTANAESVSETVAEMAQLHELDQVVVIGWREKDQRFIAVAHGSNPEHEQEAVIFAKRLMEGIGSPSERTDRYYGKETNEGG
jgi:hypothetical protein